MGGSRRVPLPITGSNAQTTAEPSPRETPRVTRAPAKPAAIPGTSATYVYCVVRSEVKPTVARDLELLPGAGAPRMLRLAEDLWLAVANVPLQAFGEEALRTRLQDVEWMSRCGAAHQAVMESLLDRDAVVPMTLFTIFASDARALAEARKDAARLDASLDRVAGCAEWVVRVLRGDAATSAGTGAADVSPDNAVRGTQARSGREFLQAKVDQRQAVRRAAEETIQAVRGLMDALSEVADNVIDRTDARTTGAVTSTALLDAAFLIARSGEAEFESIARRMAQPLTGRGLRVSVTGPWPCYSFVSSRPSS